MNKKEAGKRVAEATNQHITDRIHQRNYNEYRNNSKESQSISLQLPRGESEYQFNNPLNYQYND
jgi:hypothetical protein